MSYVSLNGSDPGIASAWIAATMGVKANRTLKNKMQEVHIPKVCEAVSVLATKENHLRLTSNLLYGLSLIFKQKVTVMESEVLDVNFRLQTPLFSGVKESKQTQISGSSHKIARLTDDIRFNIETDFIPEFQDVHVSQPPATLEDLLQNNFGQSILALADDNPEEGNRDISTDFANETNIAVDFEFDFMGNIIEPEDNSRPLLELLNTEEDFAASRPTIDDISKSNNSIGNDQHFTTTLDPVRSTVAETRPKKKRKLRLLIDDVTTFSPVKPSEELLTVARPNGGFQEVYRHVSLHQPMFLNTNRELLFPIIPSVQGCFLEDRRQRNMGLYGEVEIERGRNLSSRRRSSSVFDLIGQDFNFEDLDLNFLTEAATAPPPRVEESPSAQELESQNSKKLEDFAKYLRERMTEVSAQSPETANNYSFEALLPSQPGRDAPVSRKVAANSFAYMLQLAGQGEMEFSEFGDFNNLNGGELQPRAPSEVYVKFL